ncbi:UNVERIFIED_CONTAM: hypothetical protein FKN15_062159 [Acipenser sinensis]
MFLFPAACRRFSPASYALRGTGDRPPPLDNSYTVKTGPSAALSRGYTHMPPPAAKRVCGLKMPAGLRIGTHNGTFHCDEVLACFLLKQLPEYKDAEIVRTRDPALLSECDVVVDVGGEFDPKRHRYDHHQRTSTRSVTETLTDRCIQRCACVYENFVEEIDAIDNGISQWDGEPRYTVTSNLSSRVGHLNPRWNDKDQDTQVDVGGEVVVFTQGGCPWKEHLFNLEQELGIETTVKFVLYPDQSGQWRVQCVPAGPHTFQNRLSLPEAWRGVRDDALSTLSGIPGCVFVHASGFIGGNRTREGALAMARHTLKGAAKSSANGN